MTIYRAYEQLTVFFNDDVSGTNKRKLSRSGHQFFFTYFILSQILSGNRSLSKLWEHVRYIDEIPLAGFEKKL